MHGALMNDIEEVLARTQKHAVDYLTSLDQRPVNATATLTDLRRRLDVPLTRAGVGAGRVIDDLVAATEGGHLGSAGGRFFAWVIGGALPICRRRGDCGTLDQGAARLARICILRIYDGLPRTGPSRRSIVKVPRFSREVIELLDAIVDRPAPVMANRVAGLLSQLFRYGIHRQIVESSPVQLLFRPGGTERPRQRGPR